MISRYSRSHSTKDSEQTSTIIISATKEHLYETILSQSLCMNKRIEDKILSNKQTKSHFKYSWINQMWLLCFEMGSQSFIKWHVFQHTQIRISYDIPRIPQTWFIHNTGNIIIKAQ